MAKDKNDNKNEKNINAETSSTAAMDGGRTKLGVGIVLLLVAVFGGALVLNFADDYYFTENLLMLVCMFVCASLAVFGLRTLAIVVTGLQIVSYYAYKVYGLFVNGESIDVILYSWILIPTLAMVGMAIFASGLSKMKIDNDVLKRQVDDLVMIDSLTGLYNLRSLFMDIQTQVSYAERNGNAISLMVIKLRYPAEMKKVLKADQYNSVIKALSTLLCDTVRLEDKVYAIAPDGVFGIVLTCDKSGTKIVEKRMRGKLEAGEWLAGISDRPIRGEVKIGALEYKKDKYHRDANGFLDSVMEEVEYDI